MDSSTFFFFFFRGSLGEGEKMWEVVWKLVMIKLATKTCLKVIKQAG